VEIVARDASGRIADAIEARDHPFFIGMQGHPELSSASGAPHPLLSAFLRAAADRA
jgi:CTP synthase